MKMYNNYKDLLNTLKKRYEFNEVSALIGAGFSKNLYSNFPNWEELLRDMIIEIFSIEIDDAYSQLRHTKQYCKHIESKSSFTAKYVTNIINRYGYLDIVSMYIDKMGYRECIDLYIEKHIPYLDLSTNQLIFKGHTVEIKQEDTKVHEALLSLNKLNNIFTTNYDNIIEEVAKSSKDNTWVKICSSYDLKLSSLFKPIVKVHGDIRKKDDYNFHFDGDHNIQYVISKQDYEDYPRKHEAFMQLMRLSLLRETFMLFGFSGDDPNFVAWVKWVRDILVKNKDQDSEISTSEYYKIYLFAVDDKEPADDKIQYYINNHIIYIPILNSKILSLIGLPEDCKDVQKVIIKILTTRQKIKHPTPIA
ncbi:MAG: SIR2 family protein [Rikenellaceae bacterium]